MPVAQWGPIAVRQRWVSDPRAPAHKAWRRISPARSVPVLLLDPGLPNLQNPWMTPPLPLQSAMDRQESHSTVARVLQPVALAPAAGTEAARHLLPEVVAPRRPEAQVAPAS